MVNMDVGYDTSTYAGKSTYFHWLAKSISIIIQTDKRKNQYQKFKTIYQRYNRISIQSYGDMDFTHYNNKHIASLWNNRYRSNDSFVNILLCV